MLQHNIQCSWWWAYVPETCRAKNTSMKLPRCIKLTFNFISWERCTVKQHSSWLWGCDLGSGGSVYTSCASGCEHSNGNVENFFIRRVTINVSKIPLCGVGYLYIRCNEYSKRILGQEVFIFSSASRPAVGPTNLSIRRVPQFRFLRIKQLEREAYYLPLTSICCLNYQHVTHSLHPPLVPFATCTRETLLPLPSLYYIPAGPGTALCLDRTVMTKESSRIQRKQATIFITATVRCGLCGIWGAGEISANGMCVGEECDLLHVVADFTVLLGICLPLVCWIRMF